MIEPMIESMGFELVRVMMTGGERRVLQIMIERADEGAMVVEDCAAVSRAVSAILDVEDPIKEAYALEVTSPGIDRPLTRRKDFERFFGFEAKVELEQPLNGRRQFRGRLAGVDGDAVWITVVDDKVALPIDDIRKAKLVLTDELLASVEAGSIQ
jgi:ribosome maturation factor RimP